MFFNLRHSISHLNHSHRVSPLDLLYGATIWATLGGSLKTFKNHGFGGGPKIAQIWGFWGGCQKAEIRMVFNNSPIRDSFFRRVQ